MKFLNRYVLLFAAMLGTFNHADIGSHSNDKEPKLGKCARIENRHLTCELPPNCIYGSTYNISCSRNRPISVQHNCENEPGVNNNETHVERHVICRMCYQTPASDHICSPRTNCITHAADRWVLTDCKVGPNVLCSGNRHFYKKVLCNWTSGYKWSTALIFSVTLGGFGADRFYLGLWESALGKLFSFGGLGVWTIVDVILIACGYVGPADGSIYMR